jgi:hypothetical protein
MKRLLPLLVGALLATLAFAGPAAAARPGTGGLVLDNVTGTSTNTVGQVSNFVGDVTISRVSNDAGQLVATGTITGTLTNTVTGAVTQVTDTFSTAISLAQGATCEILDLTLGPLNLDLLGLVVDLSQIDLTITAEQGPGNLLGNLLCAVAGLLDGPNPIGGILNGIANLLNQILSILS